MPTKITWCEHTSTVKTFSCILSEEELALYNEGDEQFSECGEFFLLVDSAAWQHCRSHIFRPCR